MMVIETLIPVIFQSAAASLVPAFGSDIVQMVLNAGLMVKFILFILFVFSFLSWTIIFLKWRLFWRARQETAYFHDLFWEGMEFAKLYQECDDLVFSPVAQMFKLGYSELIRIRKIQDTSPAKGSNEGGLPLMDNVRRALKKATIDQGNRMDKALSFLATTGNTTPFIGLFGTVWGIMESFRGIGLKGSANLAVVAPGISEALIATAAGLAAAIPAVVAFNYFNRKALVFRAEMDTFESDFLSLIERQYLRKQLALKDS